ncbi:MAG TPA: hypothetical protein VFI06_18150 [Chitinophagaceae bacterium]|nr:hypothetical protein [Chitinophagaceae bacterium]
MKSLKHILVITAILLVFGNCTKESSDSMAANANTSASGAGGSTAKFTIAGNYLYVVDNTGLKAFQISDPQHPIYKSKTEIGVNIETIFPYEDKLFIGSSSAMYIYSLTDPANPQRIARAEYNIRMSCDPVIAKDSVAYATLRSSGPCGGGQSALVTYNIKNLASPVLVNTNSLTSPYGLGMKDNALYVCQAGVGLFVYNITNRYSPFYVRTISGETFYDVIPYGNILIAQIAGGLALYDIGTNPLQPVFISKILQ